MALDEINQYPVTATDIGENSFIDIDQYISPGVWESQKVPKSVLQALVTAFNQNFGNTDLTFTSNRLHDTNGFDFQLTTDTGATLLFTEASTDRVGIGTNTPLAKHHVEITAIPSDEIIQLWSVSDSSNGLRVINGTSADNTFLPSLVASSVDNDNIGMIYVSQITIDTGVNPVTVFDSRLPAAIVAVRPLFSWESFGTPYMIMDVAGNLGVNTILPQAKVDIHAQGSLSTDKVLNIRNSADTADILSINGDGSFVGLPCEFQFAASDETTDLTTGTAKITFRMPYAMTLTDIRASLTTAPTGATVIIGVNQGGTTVLSTDISIDISEKTSTTAAVPPVISVSALTDDSEITVDIDQIGSTIAGAGLKITLIGTRS